MFHPCSKYGPHVRELHLWSTHDPPMFHPHFIFKFVFAKTLPLVHTHTSQVHINLFQHLNVHV